jgi:soluble lytic murein transglycosylase-like protein
MAIVSQIESNNNANAFNSGSGAIGLCQVTPILLKEYNQIWGENFRRHELFNPQVNMQIAEWYMNQRIPYLLKHFNQPDTLENRLLAYNAGIRAVIKHRMPKESRNYILKYKRLAKGV